MAEPEGRSALTSGIVEAPGRLRMAERRGLAMRQISTRPESLAAAAFRQAAGFDLPAANRAASSDDVTALWLGPGRWLAVGGVARSTERLETGLAGLAATIDVGHARTVIRIAGPAARDLLQKEWPLDLDDDAFPRDAVAQSVMHHVGCLLHAVDDRPPTYDFYVPRSFAAWLHEVLVDAGAEWWGD
jgi:sarcosine oxidase subunit gamma